MLENVRPMDIERRSFEIITELLGEVRLKKRKKVPITVLGTKCSVFLAIKPS